MKRYYYTDPLAAAWMAKHHGMKLKTPRGQNMYWDGGSDFRTEKDCGFFCGEKYYIHPDSEALLEPKEGDTIKGLIKGSVSLATLVIQDVMCGTEDSAFAFINRGAKIILRDEVIFHWPESEEE